jgi:hypothetical protein
MTMSDSSVRKLRLAPALALLCGGLVLGGCEGVKEQLGLDKQSPDEFRVVSRAPLTIPPEFSLRPPRPGAPRPQEGTPTQQAKTAVFRVDEPQGVQVSSAGRSTGEAALLDAAGADEAEPNIREIVERETLQLNDESETFIDTLVFWRDPQPTGDVVDAAAEADRLRENAALGRPVTEGETPQIERRQRGIFEGVFE